VQKRIISFLHPLSQLISHVLQNWLAGGLCRMESANRTMLWEDLFELRGNSIWTLQSTNAEKSSRGSAVAISADRLATNCHLIHNPDTVTLTQGSLRIQGQVVASDKKGDRCIVGVSQDLASYVRSARPFGTLRVGEEVAAIGNPRGLEASLSKGIVAQKRNNSGLAYIQTDAALSTGSSGGGLFDAAGNLVGITTFKVDQGENLNFAIAIDEFCR
jgi:serine protease Do